MSKPDLQPTVTALLCTLNEAASLPHVLPRMPEWVDEVLLVDGHSSDDTIEIAKQLCPQIRVLVQPGKGKGDALRHGIQQATGDIVVTLDADGETDPGDMENFIRPLLDGYDFAKGSRFRIGALPKRAFHRIFGAVFLALAFDLCFLRGYTDICSGYNAFWSKSMARVDLEIRRDFPAEPTLHARAAKAGLRVKEVAHRTNGRIGGEPKVPVWWRHGLWVLMGVLRERVRG